MNFGLLFQKWSLGTQKLFCKVLDQLDTLLNNYGLINSQSMLIYHLKLKQLYLGNGCSDRKNNNIFDPRGGWGIINWTFIFTRHQPRLFLKALLVSVVWFVWYTSVILTYIKSLGRTYLSFYVLSLNRHCHYKSWLVHKNGNQLNFPLPVNSCPGWLQCLLQIYMAL